MERSRGEDDWRVKGKSWIVGAYRRDNGKLLKDANHKDSSNRSVSLPSQHEKQKNRPSYELKKGEQVARKKNRLKAFGAAVLCAAPNSIGRSRSSGGKTAVPG